MTRSNADIRVEGERHVLTHLRRKGIEYRLQSRRARNDILVKSGTGLVTLQVRVTSLGQRQGWILTKEVEGASDDRLLYAFVNTAPSEPEIFFVPAHVVADVLRTSHAAWLATPGRAGRAHVDHPMRMVLMDYRFPVQGYPPGWLEQYRDRWDLLQTGD